MDLQLLPQGHGVVCRLGVDDIIVFVLELFFFLISLFLHLLEQIFMGRHPLVVVVHKLLV